jgi:hypothetical protein
MSKLFLSENRFTPIKINVSEPSRFYARSTKDVKVVIEAIEPSPDNTNTGEEIYGPDYRNYKANVLIGNKVAFSCNLLELNALITSLSSSVNTFNNLI